jgi:hypothetical protein
MRHLLALSGFVLVLGVARAQAEQPYVAALYKNPPCSCCEAYAD